MIDWHNLGFKMFEERLGEGHVLVLFSKYLELSALSLAQHHICVSKALQQWLAEHCRISASVVYDRPASMFKQYDINLVHNLLVKLNLTESVFTSRGEEEHGEYLSSALSTHHFDYDLPHCFLSIE